MISSESWSYLGASCALLDLIGLLRRRWIPTTATSRAQTYFEIFKRYQWDLFSPPLWPSIIVNYISSLYLYIEIDKSSSSWSIEPKNNLLMLNWKYPSIEFVSFVQLSPFFALAPLKVEKSAHMSAPSLSHQSSFLPISTKSRPTHLPHIPQTFPTRVFGLHKGEKSHSTASSGLRVDLPAKLRKLQKTHFSIQICHSLNFLVLCWLLNNTFSSVRFPFIASVV